jgi:hypothetical protein
VDNEEAFMRSLLVSAQSVWHVSVRGVALLVATVAFGSSFVTAAVAASSQSDVSLESPEVVEELSHELQQPGPSIVTQGARGGNGDETAPAGELVPGLSSEYSDTWAARNQPLTTRVFQEPVNFKNQEGDWQAIDTHLVSSEVVPFAVEVRGGGLGVMVTR